MNPFPSRASSLYQKRSLFPMKLGTTAVLKARVLMFQGRKRSARA
jgi:hypothetical protein